MADVILQITVKDAHVQRAVDAIAYGVGKRVEIEICHDETGARYGFEFTYSGDGNVKTQAESFLKAALIAFVRAYEFGKDRERFDAAVESITPPSQDVPDDMVE